MGGKYIQSILKRSIKEGKIISVYTNRYQPEKCSVGFIDSLTSEHFIMKHVTPEGISDGFIVRRIEDIFRVDVDGEYEQRINLLYSLQNQQHQNFVKVDEIRKSNLFKESLLIAQKQKLVVSVCIDDTENQDDIIGYVKDVISNGVTISRISFNGLDDGESSFFIEDIVKLNCDSSDEKILKLLNSYKTQELL
jgi:hypothetical protein